MNKLIFIILLFTQLYTWAQAKQVLSDSEVEIIFVTENNMFPSSWYEGKVHAHATSLDKKEQRRSLHIIQKALKKYPAEFLKRHLKKVYVLHTLEFFGQKFGGTYAIDKDVVYLSNKGTRLGYTNQYIEQVFHAEFSSLLFNTYPHYFPKEDWINASKIQHGNSGVTALQNGETDENFEHRYHEYGFLNQYAMSSIENDFNSFAKNIFAADRSFWTSINRYQLLKQKKMLIIQFYTKLDEHFNEQFFKKISR